MPWGWGDSAIEYQRWWTADDVGGDFLDAVAAQESPAEQEAFSNAIGQFLGFKIEEQYVEPFDFAHDDVEEYLLRHFPRAETAPDEDLPHIPERLARFLRWLGEKQHIDPELAATLANDASRLREEFVTRARDASLFGPQKLLLLEMKSAGVDLDDAAAVERFMEGIEARMDDDPDMPLAQSAKKWVWTPGDPTPDPKGLCPCGSGKRYKKCCMPR
jgi:hypothetical protein